MSMDILNEKEETILKRKMVLFGMKNREFTLEKINDELKLTEPEQVFLDSIVDRTDEQNHSKHHFIQLHEDKGGHYWNNIYSLIPEALTPYSYMWNLKEVRDSVGVK